MHPGAGFTLPGMKHLQVSELARGAGVPVSTVRFYERIGLVPEPSRTPSGYRLYESTAARRLGLITRGKALGLSLEEVRALLDVWDGTNCVDTRARL